MDLAIVQFRRVDPPVINSPAATGHSLLPETCYPLVLHDSASHFRLAVSGAVPAR